jgi:RHS repeat-associated protein
MTTRHCVLLASALWFAGFFTSATSAATPSDRSVLTAAIQNAQSAQVVLDRPIVLHLSAPLAESSLNASSVTLVGPTGSVPVEVSAAAEGSEITLSPTTDLEPEARYTVFIAGAKRSDGQDVPMVATSFSTAALAAGENTVPAQSSARYVMAGPGNQNETCDSKKNLRGYRFCHAQGSVAGGIFTPGLNNTDGHWRAYVDQPELAGTNDFPATTFAPGHTYLYGTALRIDDKPLVGATITLGAYSTRTDAHGRFVLRDVPSGHQVVFVDGSTANRGDEEYGEFLADLDVQAQKANAVPYNFYVPRIAARDKISLPSPTVTETVITHPAVPGLEIHIPAGAVIRDRNGKVLTQVAIVPIPVDRSPVPVPANFLTYFSMQPGGATIDGLTTTAAEGFRTVYPNYSSDEPGRGLWYYDAEGAGWASYTDSHVSPDGRSIVSTSPWGAKTLMPKGGPPSCCGGKETPDLMCCNESGPSADATAPAGGTSEDDPVDTATGQFYRSTTDLVVDGFPFTRTYNSGDDAAREFGTGGSTSSSMWLSVPGNTGCQKIDGVLSQLNLVTSQGSFPFFAQAGDDHVFGGSPVGSVLTHTDSASRFYGAILYPLGDTAFLVQLRDGTTFVLSAGCPSNVISMTDAFGNMTSFSYVAGFLSRITMPSGRFVNLSYSAGNRVSSIADNTGRTVAYAYNAGGKLTTVTYPDSTTETYTYDAAGRMATVTDRRGLLAVTNEYDSNGRVIKQTDADGVHTFAYTLNGTRVSATDATDTRGVVRHLGFDAKGYAQQITKAYGTALAQTWTYTRGQGELVTSFTDPQNRVTTMTYDSTGNLLMRTYLYGTPNAATYTYTYTSDLHQVASVTDPLNHTTTYGYTNGCLTSITDALNHTATIVCNGAGQPLSITDPLNHTTTMTYVGTDLRTVTDPLSRTTTFHTDALGRVFSVVDPLGRETLTQYDSNGRVAQTTDALKQTTTYGYDGNGNLISVTDPAGGVTHYGYDTRNRRNSRIDQLNHPAETWTYDAAGNVQTFTDRKGQLTQYQYDALNRPSLVTYNDGSTITPTFDTGNRMTQIVDSVSGTIARSYDGLDRLTQEQTPQGTVNYTYDAAGRRATMTPASQAQISYTYDNADRLTAITQGTQNVAISYDNADRRTTLTLPNGVVTAYSYDNGDQLTSITYQTSGGTTLATVNYSYDIAGRRISRTGGFGADLLPTPSTGTNQFDLNNRQTLWNSSILGYDLNGDPTSNAATTPATTYTFDVRHRLTQIQQGSTTIASFTYDAFDRRTSKTIGGAATTFLYDGQNAVQEVQGATTTTLLTGFGIDERFARDDAAYGRTYFLADALGSTVGLMDASQVLRQSYAYEPFGENQPMGASANSYKYTGREDDGTGLYYYRARYYSPSLKRFISEDPVGLAAGLNSYAYVFQNPILYRDPSGKFVPLLIAAVRVALIAYSAYKGYKAGQEFAREQDCARRRAEQQIRQNQLDGMDGLTSAQKLELANQEVANGMSSYGYAAAKGLAAAAASGLRGPSPWKLAGFGTFALGAWLGSGDPDCTCAR